MICKLKKIVKNTTLSKLIQIFCNKISKKDTFHKDYVQIVEHFIQTKI